MTEKVASKPMATVVLTGAEAIAAGVSGSVTVRLASALVMDPPALVTTTE